MRRPFRSPALDKRNADQKILQRLARKAEGDDRTKVLNGAHGPAFRDLERFLRQISLDDGRALVAFIEASPLRGADALTRRLATRAVGERIRRLKANDGRPDSDPLPGEPESARQAVVRLLRDGPP